MKKSELKTRYKDLVRQGSRKEAEKVLNELRFYSRNGNFSSSGNKPQPKPEKSKPKELDAKYTKDYLDSLDFDQLRDVGYKIGAKGRSKKGLIKDILAIQSGKMEPEIK